MDTPHTSRKSPTDPLIGLRKAPGGDFRAVERTAPNRVRSRPGRERPRPSLSSMVARAYPSAPGTDLLIVNQHRWVHGREPLGDGQHTIAPEERRLLLQLFLRNRNDVPVAG